jgi:serine/threonine protein phosphatase PrpC
MVVELTVAGRTEVGLVRRSNEDAFLIADLAHGLPVAPSGLSRFELGPRGALLAVSDGMGGNQAGEVASAIVVESLRRSLAETSEREASDVLLERAVMRANRDVWDAGHSPGQENMGATLTAVLLRDKTAYLAEVGDSRAYLVRGGHIKQVTHDQSYVQLMIDSGVMDTEEAERSELNSVILQAMGLRERVQIALGRIELRQSDCFVLCSDGLSNTMSSDEMRKIVLTSGLPDAVCGRLVQLAMRRGGGDNITVIVAGVRGELRAPVAGERISDTLLTIREFQPPALTRP